MNVTPEMIARAKRCDCEKCKRHLAELEKAWGERVDLEKTSGIIETFFKRFS